MDFETGFDIEVHCTLCCTVHCHCFVLLVWGNVYIGFEFCQSKCSATTAAACTLLLPLLLLLRTNDATLSFPLQLVLVILLSLPWPH